MTRAPAKPPTAPRRKPAEPANQSRGTGVPVPESTASRRAPEAFFNPDATPAQRAAALENAGLSELAALRGPIEGASERFDNLHPQAPVEIEENLTGDDIVVASAQVADAAGGADETLEQAIERIRSIRKPLGEFSLKLAIDKRRGYHTHWFNDQGARIEEALANGWAFRKRDGKPIRRSVGMGRDNGVLYAYVMDLPLVFWQEDQDAKHRTAQGKMDALTSAPFQAKQGTAQKSDKGKFYDPSESEAGPLSIQKG